VFNRLVDGISAAASLCESAAYRAVKINRSVAYTSTATVKITAFCLSGFLINYPKKSAPHSAERFCDAHKMR
jgi:hypothetical protein